MTFKNLLKSLCLFAFLVFAMVAHAQTGGVPVMAPTPSAQAALASAPSFISVVWNWLMGPPGAILFFCLYSVCEVLANNPNIKANSFFQLVMNGLAKAEKKNPMPGSNPPAAS